MQKTSDLKGIGGPVLDYRQPTGDQIATSLRAAIIDMTIPPGGRMSEADLAEEFGASRTPVRDALSALRAEGLIETQPSRGTFVTLLSETNLRGAHLVRETLEHRVARELCAHGLTPAAEAALRALLDQQKAALDAKSMKAFHAADDAFHRAMAEATGHPRLAEAIAREKLVLDRLRALRLGDDGHAARLWDDHRHILAALKQRDAAAAQAILSRNMVGILDILSDLHHRHGEYFA